MNFNAIKSCKVSTINGHNMIWCPVLSHRKYLSLFSKVKINDIHLNIQDRDKNIGRNKLMSWLLEDIYIGRRLVNLRERKCHNIFSFPRTLSTWHKLEKSKKLHCNRKNLHPGFNVQHLEEQKAKHPLKRMLRAVSVVARKLPHSFLATS